MSSAISRIIRSGFQTTKNFTGNNQSHLDQAKCFFSTSVSEPLSGAQYLEQHTAPERPLDILFFGSTEFAVKSLKKLHEMRSISDASKQAFPVVGKLEVVVPPTKMKKVGKTFGEVPSPVEACAVELGLEVHRVPSSSNFKMQGFTLPAHPNSSIGETWDLGVVVAFGYMVPPSIIASFPMDMINAHGSLLPKFRGAAPMQYAIITGESETGVSITSLHPTRIDAGRVIIREKVPITPETTYTSLSDELSTLAANAIGTTVSKWNSVIKDSVEQSVLEQQEGVPPSHLLKCPKIKPEFCVINFEEKTAFEISCLIRGLAGFEPAFASFDNKRVFFEDVTIFDQKYFDKAPCKRDPSVDYSIPGSVCFDRKKKSLLITCKDNTYISVEKLRIEAQPRVWEAVNFISNLVTKFNIHQFDSEHNFSHRD